MSPSKKKKSVEFIVSNWILHKENKLIAQNKIHNSPNNSNVSLEAFCSATFFELPVPNP